jgi:hypothetical protein
LGKLNCGSLAYDLEGYVHVQQVFIQPSDLLERANDGLYRSFTTFSYPLVHLDASIAGHRAPEGGEETRLGGKRVIGSCSFNFRYPVIMSQATPAVMSHAL